MYEEQQEELVKPREKNFRDQIGDNLQKENENKEIQPRKDPTIEMWMNRFGSWYSAIDRVSQNVKAKFVQMKSEIVNAIKSKIQERKNRKEQIEQQNKEVEEEAAKTATQKTETETETPTKIVLTTDDGDIEYDLDADGTAEFICEAIEVYCRK